MNGNQLSARGTTLLGAQRALGLILGGWILGAPIKATRLSDRYVTVKGLVERQVKSDLAIWPISSKEAGDDLASVYARTEADKNTIQQFLTQQGIQPSEIELGVVRVVDTQAQCWRQWSPTPFPLARRPRSADRLVAIRKELL